MIRLTIGFQIMLSCALYVNTITAQTNDSKKADMVSEIFKNRSLLKENILDENTLNIEKLYQTLESQSNRSSFSALNYREQILILAWLKKYDQLIEKALTITSEQEKEERVLKLSVSDFLEETLIHQTTQRIGDIVENIKQTSLNDNEKLFAEIALKWILKENKRDGINQATINELSKEYLEQFPKGEHATVIKTTFQNNDKTGDYGYSAMIGAGVNLSDKKNNDVFTSPGLLTIDFDYHVKRYGFGVSAMTYITKTATALPLNDTELWNENSATNHLVLSLHGAYKPWQTDKNTLIIRAGYQSGWIIPIGNDAVNNPALDNYSVKMYGIRLSTAISHVFKQRTISTLDPDRQNISQYGIQLQYSMGINQYSKEIKGVSLSHSITFGFYLGGFNKQS